MTDDIKRDLLEAPRKLNAGDQFDAYTLLLREMKLAVRELRKTHPSQRCVVRTEITGPDPRYLTGPSDRARITFLANGNKVKSQYLIISNNTNSPIGVGINESIKINGALTTTGMMVQGNPGNSIIPVTAEVEFLEISNLAAGGPFTVTVNNSDKGVDLTPGGAIYVYAWTIPEASYEEI